MRCSEYHVSGLVLTLLRRRLKNKFANPTPLGYRDVNSNIRLQLGDDRKHLAELEPDVRVDVAVAERRRVRELVLKPATE